MGRWTRCLAFALIATPAAAMTGDSVQMTPGRWEVVMTVSSGIVGGIAAPAEMLGPQKPTFDCISPKEAADPARYFWELATDEECTAPVGSAGSGQFNATATCSNADFGPTALTVEGTYGRDSYRLSMRARGTRKGRTFAIDSVMEGRFVGACTS